MGDIDAMTHRLVQSLRPQVTSWADDLMRELRDELPDLWEHKELQELTLREIADLMNTLLDLLDGQIALADISAPAVVVAAAHENARGGLPLSEALRAFRLGHMLLLRRMQAEVIRLTDDPVLVSSVVGRVTDVAFSYVDISSEQVVAAYQEERERRLRQRLALTDAAGRHIGTTLDIMRTAEELVEVATESFADLVVVDVLDSAVEEAHMSHRGRDEFLLQRMALGPAGSAQDSSGGTRVHRYSVGSAQARVLESGQPLRRIGIGVREAMPWRPDTSDGARDPAEYHSALVLPLQARGNLLGLAQFFRAGSAVPFDQDDLSLAQEIAARTAVSIDNARLYTQERLTALTLQRSLLPQRTTRNAMVDTAARYLPSGGRAGLGGDWYDVIPLSGARVALVVGDVAGRGLEAAATMGRLRMAVRAFADIDLMPDELLTHLDDVVIRMQHEEGREDVGLSATCLYAVYDSSTGVCSLSSAGHVLPAVVTVSPSGPGEASARSVSFLDAPVGPPLGVGGLPFETTQFELPGHSLLAFYTDGLIGSSAADFDAAPSILREELGKASESLEEICDRVLGALVPDRPADDTTLLMVRPRTLDARHIAVLDVESDPAAVAGARSFAADRLRMWGWSSCPSQRN
ncbi:PP2C family protein-serine/threonine phosphatase [Streptomyces sp. NPDC096319]|uniref:PP2C family protein-serine/threonine phosphatase n=1 Tax=Streptomyces sp. NPDC096319 TaxID=3366084 RepID=UPI00381B15BE